MARANETHVLVTPQADAHQQIGTGGSIVLAPNCVALLLGARTQNMFVTFDNSTPSTGNGLVIVAGAQPVYIPLGYHADGAHTVKTVEAAATGLLDVVQLA